MIYFDKLFIVLRQAFALGVILFIVWHVYTVATAEPVPFSESECISMAQMERWTIPQQCYDDFGDEMLCQQQGNKRGEYLPAKCLKYFKS